jgi:flagellar biosynthesis/type III secretory pathway M-ring protein FliF/YscJ
MSARPVRAPDHSPKTPPAPRTAAAPAPSFVPVVAESDDTGPERSAVVPSTSRLSAKVRGLVERHPEETLSVLRRWMVA